MKVVFPSLILQVFGCANGLVWTNSSSTMRRELPFSQWGSVFLASMLTVAIYRLDQSALVHGEES